MSTRNRPDLRDTYLGQALARAEQHSVLRWLELAEKGPEAAARELAAMGAVPETEIHDVTVCARCFRPVDAHDRECPTRGDGSR